MTTAFWCILRHLYQEAPNRNVNRITDLRDKIVVFDQKTRMELASNFNEENLKNFERANNLRINIYLIGDKEGEVDPWYLSDNENGVLLNLGLIHRKDENSLVFHYVLIKNLANIVKRDRSNHKYYVCDRCLYLCQGEEALNRHKKDCYHEHIDLILPKEDTWLKFKHVERTQWYPGCVYADFEATSIESEAENKRGDYNVIQIPNSVAISPISPLGRIKPFQKYKPQLKLLEMKKVSNKST
jgi:hypothetical protein